MKELDQGYRFWALACPVKIGFSGRPYHITLWIQFLPYRMPLWVNDVIDTWDIRAFGTRKGASWPMSWRPRSVWFLKCRYLYCCGRKGVTQGEGAKLRNRYAALTQQWIVQMLLTWQHVTSSFPKLTLWKWYIKLCADVTKVWIFLCRFRLMKTFPA